MQVISIRVQNHFWNTLSGEVVEIPDVHAGYETNLVFTIAARYREQVDIAVLQVSRVFSDLSKLWLMIIRQKHGK